MGELRHAMGAYTTQVVDIRHCKFVVRPDKYMLALQQRLKLAKSKQHCWQLEAIYVPLHSRSCPGAQGCMPVAYAPQPVLEASVVTTICPVTCAKGTPTRRSAGSDQGLKKRSCDRIHLHTEKINALHRRELALLPVDPKPQMAEVLKHQIPVLAQQITHVSKH